jgi:tetratricopeptide (TPR) repeat protein
MKSVIACAKKQAAAASFPSFTRNACSRSSPSIMRRVTSAPARGRRAADITAALVVSAVTAAVFARTIGFGWIDWDDPLYLTENPHFRGFGADRLAWMFTTFRGSLYQPLTWLSFAVDHALWAMNPAGYHLTNVALHALNAALVYALALVLCRVDGRLDIRPSRWAATAGALLFAVHPLRVESVAWVVERKDVLSGCFLLLSLLAYVRWARDANRSAYVASAVLMACSLLAKAWAITLPAIMLVLDVHPLGRWSREPKRRLLLEKAPFAALALASIVTTVSALLYGGAAAPLERISVVDRVLRAGSALALYAGKSIVPVNLSPLYVAHAPTAGTNAVALASLLAAAGVSIVLWRRRRTHPAVCAAWFSSLIVLAPVLGLAQAGLQVAADRFLYVASIPWAVVLGAAVGRVSSSRPAAAAAVASAVIVSLAARAIDQSSAWRDTESLWTQAIRADPQNYAAYAYRGNARFRAFDLDGARRDFDESIRILPGFAPAFDGRGLVRSTRGDAAGAIADYERALTLDPHIEGTRVRRGLVRLAQGDAHAALADFEEEARLYPSSADAVVNRGVARLRLGEVAAAIADFERALVMDPLRPERYLHNRGLARLAKNDAAGAAADFTAVIRLDPSALDAWLGRSACRSNLGDRAGAAADLAAALERAPRDWPKRAAVEAALHDMVPKR